MRCPFCQQNIRVQGRFCPKCGEQIFGLPVDRPRPQAPATPPAAPGPRPAPTPRTPAPGPTHTPPSDSEYIEISLDDETPAGGRSRPAQPAEIGKNCPFCRFPIKPGEQVFACPACKVIHHDECWQENEGCTTYGCRGAVVAATPATIHPSGQHAPTGVGGHPSVHIPEAVAQGMRVNELSARATNALWLSILGLLCGCLPALIGMMMGISVLGELKTVRMMPGANAAHGRAVAAVIIGAVLSLGWLLWLIASSLEA